MREGEGDRGGRGGRDNCVKVYIAARDYAFFLMSA